MKRFFSVIIGLVLIGSAMAQEYATASLVTNTLTSVLASPVKLTRLTLTATSANTTTFKFYDMAGTTSSNVVYASYYSPTTYATNYSVTWTNTTADGQTYVGTNTFAGQYTAWTLVSASTNERPRTVTIAVPGSTTRTVDVTRYLKFGLVGQANHNGVVEAEYLP